MNLRRGFVPAQVLARVVAGRLGLPIRARTLVRRLRTEVSVKRMRAAGYGEIEALVGRLST